MSARSKMRGEYMWLQGIRYERAERKPHPVNCECEVCEKTRRVILEVKLKYAASNEQRSRFIRNGLIVSQFRSSTPPQRQLQQSLRRDADEPTRADLRVAGRVKGQSQ